MSKALKSFLVHLVYLTLIVYAVGFAVFKFVYPSDFYTFFAFLPLIFYAVNTVFHGTLVQASYLELRKFTQRFLIVFGIKIMLLLAFIITYAYFNPEKAVPFLITFFLHYLVYTTFEIVSIVRYQKKIRT